MKKIKSFFTKLKNNDLCKNIVFYTIIFAFLIGYLIFYYHSLGKQFINSDDGVKQHILNLQYYREILINFLRNGNFSTFTWYLGNGFDLFGSFAYVILGDVFSYLSILVRTKDIELLYNVLIIVRIYFIGISFLCYTNYHKIKRVPSIIGALLYTFSVFNLFACFRHPFYTNAIILFPLLMMGIEKIIKENKKIFYIFIIAILYLINFYFAYTFSLIIALYGTFLAISMYKKDGYKKIIAVLIKVLFCSLIGIAISGIILLPTIASLSLSNRLNSFSFSYSLTYYRNLGNEFLANRMIGYWSNIGMQSLIFIILPAYILSEKTAKEKKPMILLLLLLLLALFEAKISSVFVGFSYPNNRWSFIIIFITTCIIVNFFNNEYEISKKSILISLFLILLYLFLNIIFDINLSSYNIIQINLFIVWLLFLFYKNKIINLSSKIYNLMLLCLTILCSFLVIKYSHSIDGTNEIFYYIEENKMKEISNTSNETIPDFKNGINFLQSKDNSFYSIIKKPYKYENVSLNFHFNSLDVYQSIIPKLYSELNLDLQNSQYEMILGPKEYDYRTKITTLLGSKYLIAYNDSNVPYGYSILDDYKGKSKIYKNNYFLPFGVLYTNFITEDDFNKLNALQKESSLLKNVVIDKNINTIENSNLNFPNINEINYTSADNELLNKSVEIKDLNNTIFKINVDDVKESELYLVLENFNYIPYSKKEMINLKINSNMTTYEKEKIKKQYKWYEPSLAYNLSIKFNNFTTTLKRENWTSAYYLDNKNFVFNLGYYQKTSGTIEINLASLGHYTFDNIKVYAVNFADYDEDIKNLKRSNFETIEYGNGYLKGKTNIEENGILQFATIYREGWNVYVDGKKVDTLKSNKYFLGIDINQGKHDIYLEYHIPYLKEGLIISVIGICSYIIIIIYDNRKRGKNENKRTNNE